MHGSVCAEWRVARGRCTFCASVLPGAAARSTLQVPAARPLLLFRHVPRGFDTADAVRSLRGVVRPPSSRHVRQCTAAGTSIRTRNSRRTATSSAPCSTCNTDYLQPLSRTMHYGHA
jgi:hypothetical protein